MSFNLNTSQNRLPTLSGATVLALEGPDAVAFAQSQFSSEVAALAPGHWHWSAWLTPKGRVVAVFALLRLDAQCLWAVLPDFPAAELGARLRRYVFRSKVTLSAREDFLACADLHGTVLPASAQPAGLLGDSAQGLLLDLSGEGGPRRLALLPAGHAAIAPPDPAVDAAWRLADLRHGLPRLGPAQAEAWTPHMLSLDRLAAFSVKKGCYPGQEIVARTHFLGQAKRGLVRLLADTALPGQGEVHGADGAVPGQIVCSADSGDAHEALAVLPLDHADTPLQSAGVVLRRAPLLGGLAR